MITIANWDYFLNSDESTGFWAGITLVRIVRIHRVFCMASFNRHMLAVLVPGTTRKSRISNQIYVRKIYNVFRLIMMTLTGIYFSGLLFQYFSNIYEGNNHTGLHTFSSNYPDTDDNNKQLALLLYFSMTTLIKVGYGDYYPLSDFERFMTIILIFV